MQEENAVWRMGVTSLLVKIEPGRYPSGTFGYLNLEFERVQPSSIFLIESCPRRDGI